ncbi:hypothetical protein LRP67_06715 [Nocardioides sp. cx-169]|uniref:hypothetical protein n=1 Tax=Nocardioides sp. cx-169 TaxID=2899080 RepID=UPI001E37E978|nr:hypothetical protein [Nocardioides sp. cx-169]MCD4533770.1 hypothetical protein [Nocardioides sp. cx-169]
MAHLPRAERAPLVGTLAATVADGRPRPLGRGRFGQQAEGHLLTMTALEISLIVVMVLALRSVLDTIRRSR